MIRSNSKCSLSRSGSGCRRTKSTCGVQCTTASFVVDRRGIPRYYSVSKRMSLSSSERKIRSESGVSTRVKMKLLMEFAE